MSKPVRLNQIELFSGICKLLDKMGVKDAEPRIVNAVVKAANDIIAEVERKTIMATDGMGLAAWLASDDTGMSSKYMAYIMCNGPQCEYAYPHDPSDFGRCYRFLKAVPGARAKLQRMSATGDVWREFVGRWEDMEMMYEREMAGKYAPELYAFMQQIIKNSPIRKAVTKIADAHDMKSPDVKGEYMDQAFHMPNAVQPRVSISCKSCGCLVSAHRGPSDHCMGAGGTCICMLTKEEAVEL